MSNGQEGKLSFWGIERYWVHSASFRNNNKVRDSALFNLYTWIMQFLLGWSLAKESGVIQNRIIGIRESGLVCFRKISEQQMGAWAKNCATPLFIGGGTYSQYLLHLCVDKSLLIICLISIRIHHVSIFSFVFVLFYSISGIYWVCRVKNRKIYDQSYISAVHKKT